MQVIEYAGAGALRLAERPSPVPGAGEVVVGVAYLGICGTDLLVWDGGLARVVPPVVLGHEFSGVVVDPNGHPELTVGRRVAVEPLVTCGTCRACARGDGNVCAELRVIGVDANGAAASLVTVPAEGVHPVPDSLSLRAAALAEPTAVAVHMLRRAAVRADHSVLVVGGGPIGALVASVCRAEKVAGLVVSEPGDRRRDILAGMGIETVDPRTSGSWDPDGFDIVFELTGIQAGLDAAISAARPQGTVLLGGIPHHRLTAAIADAVLGELVLVGSRVYDSADFAHAISLLDEGAIPADQIITREVAIRDAVEGAYTRLRDSHDDMKILVIPERGAQ